ncbi:hypothetical protein ACWXWB_14165 [Pantoea dispersa]|uniref:hypothetical protein n=1 Tax=Pantoea dispersa TaxID=59814 RepID=UPI002DB573C7|nr:hypothetical protein [Pantoea dispersa]MEB5973348.1 hypothetical protein [Pantoea dispersa]
MVQINSEMMVRSHRRHLMLGGLLMLLSLLCVAMTILFLYVNNSANQRVEDIRQQYRAISDRREEKVAELTNQLIALQQKLDARTPPRATQTAKPSAPPGAQPTAPEPRR